LSRMYFTAVSSSVSRPTTSRYFLTSPSAFMRLISSLRCRQPRGREGHSRALHLVSLSVSLCLSLSLSLCLSVSLCRSLSLSMSLDGWREGSTWGRVPCLGDGGGGARGVLVQPGQGGLQTLPSRGR
jgi:hypothetical protein